MELRTWQKPLSLLLIDPLAGFSIPSGPTTSAPTEEQAASYSSSPVEIDGLSAVYPPTKEIFTELITGWAGGRCA